MGGEEATQNNLFSLERKAVRRPGQFGWTVGPSFTASSPSKAGRDMRTMYNGARWSTSLGEGKTKLPRGSHPWLRNNQDDGSIISADVQCP